MNEAQEQRLVKSAGELVKQFKKVFDRSFTTTLDETNGKVRIVAEERDSGSDNMTVADLAVLLQTDKRTIRRMTEARAQKMSRHPIPFFKIHGKMLRFNRVKIQNWLQQMADAAPVFPPTKGKRRSVR